MMDCGKKEMTAAGKTVNRFIITKERDHKGRKGSTLKGKKGKMMLKLRVTEA